jgi:hypothetical protein
MVVIRTLSESRQIKNTNTTEAGIFRILQTGIQYFKPKNTLQQEGCCILS